MKELTLRIRHINVLYVTKSLKKSITFCGTNELTLGRSHINVLCVTKSFQLRVTLRSTK